MFPECYCLSPSAKYETGGQIHSSTALLKRGEERCDSRISSQETVFKEMAVEIELRQRLLCFFT
jgi:hypothetical protein